MDSIEIVALRDSQGLMFSGVEGKMTFRQIRALESICLFKKHGLEAKIDRWLEERISKSQEKGERHGKE